MDKITIFILKCQVSSVKCRVSKYRFSSKFALNSPEAIFAEMSLFASNPPNHFPSPHFDSSQPHVSSCIFQSEEVEISLNKKKKRQNFIAKFPKKNLNEKIYIFLLLKITTKKLSISVPTTQFTELLPSCAHKLNCS